MTAEDWKRFREVGGLRQFEIHHFSKEHTEPDTNQFDPEQPGRDYELQRAENEARESTGHVGAAGQDKCAIHDKYESIQGLYIQCFECRHVYITEQDFVDAFNDITRQANDEYERAGMQSRAPLVTTGEEVTFCGLCLHDI